MVGSEFVGIRDIVGEFLQKAEAWLDWVELHGASADKGPNKRADVASFARQLYRERRLRERHFDEPLFADPAWDILLDLYASRGEGRKVSVRSACIAAAVPPTTALRCLKHMEELGLIVREPRNGIVADAMFSLPTQLQRG